MAMNKTKRPAVSIVIPTYNEEKYLPKLLESIRSQDFEDIEIIIADRPSEDRTAEIAKVFGCRIIEKGDLPGRARNEGASAAKSDILLFLDADVILPQGFIRAMLYNFKKGGHSCATVHYRPLSNHIADKAVFFVANVLVHGLQRVRPLAAGWCIMIKKGLFEQIGGFNMAYRVCEDHDLAIRAAKKGKFAAMKYPFVWVSTRRLTKEGRLRYLTKIAASAVLYSTVGVEKIQKSISYEFGKF